MPLNVFYKGEQVGEFYADLTVNNKVIIEIKSVRSLAPMHEAQLFNYLHIASRLLVESNSGQGVVSKCRVGYLVNFQGTRVVSKRFVLG